MAKVKFYLELEKSDDENKIIVKVAKEGGKETSFEGENFGVGNAVELLHKMAIDEYNSLMGSLCYEFIEDDEKY